MLQKGYKNTGVGGKYRVGPMAILKPFVALGNSGTLPD